MPYGRLELMDFNPATGQLSNLVVLDTGYQYVPTNYAIETEVRSVEFSPDGSKLYASYVNKHSNLLQFNLNAGNTTAIAASKVVIKPDTLSSPTRRYELQLGPDGKIYKVENNFVFLSVIANPNAPGLLCNFSQNAINYSALSVFPNSISIDNLHNFISNYFEQKPILMPITTSIICGVVNFTAPSLSSAAGYSVTQYQWNFDDPLSSASNLSNLSNPIHAFTANGTYTVKLILNYYPCGADTIKQSIVISGLPILSVSGKTLVCKGESSVLNFSGASNYSINTVAVNQNSIQLTPTVSFVYTLSAFSSSSGCISKRTLSISVVPCLALNEPFGSFSEFIRVFPNPSNGNFTLYLAEDAELEVNSILGSKIFVQSLKAGEHQVDLSAYSAGIYILRAKQGSNNYSCKLLKE